MLSGQHEGNSDDATACCRCADVSHDTPPLSSSRRWEIASSFLQLSVAHHVCVTVLSIHPVCFQ